MELIALIVVSGWSCRRLMVDLLGALTASERVDLRARLKPAFRKNLNVRPQYIEEYVAKEMPRILEAFDDASSVPAADGSRNETDEIQLLVVILKRARFYGTFKRILSLLKGISQEREMQHDTLEEQLSRTLEQDPTEEAMQAIDRLEMANGGDIGYWR